MQIQHQEQAYCLLKSTCGWIHGNPWSFPVCAVPESIAAEHLHTVVALMLSYSLSKKHDMRDDSFS